MLPRVLVHIRKTVRRVTARRTNAIEPSGVENEASWQLMLDRIAQQERAREMAAHVRQTEKALARLNLN